MSASGPELGSTALWSDRRLLCLERYDSVMATPNSHMKSWWTCQRFAYNSGLNGSLQNVKLSLGGGNQRKILVYKAIANSVRHVEL